MDIIFFIFILFEQRGFNKEKLVTKMLTQNEETTKKIAKSVIARG